MRDKCATNAPKEAEETKTLLKTSQTPTPVNNNRNFYSMNRRRTFLWFRIGNNERVDWNTFPPGAAPRNPWDSADDDDDEEEEYEPTDWVQWQLEDYEAPLRIRLRRMSRQERRNEVWSLNWGPLDTN